MHPDDQPEADDNEGRKGDVEVTKERLTGIDRKEL